MSFIDPSWCARLNAHRAPPPEPVPAAPAPPADARPAPASLVRREVPSVHVCELCGTTMYDHHCKIVCPNCGYKRDCSDP
jgi:ribosomal protein L32